MTTYNTGNPIGSKDPRDLYDNAENLDTAVNDTNRDTWSDRLGRTRLTWAGIVRSGTGDTGIAVDAADRAVGAAGQAENEADRAAGAASRAENAEAVVDATNIKADVSRAETAADVAMTAGWVYATVAAGRAARADGDYFWVVSADDSEVLELWLEGATTATDTGKRVVSDNLEYSFVAGSDIYGGLSVDTQNRTLTVSGRIIKGRKSVNINETVSYSGTNQAITVDMDTGQLSLIQASTFSIIPPNSALLGVIQPNTGDIAGAAAYTVDGFRNNSRGVGLYEGGDPVRDVPNGSPFLRWDDGLSVFRKNGTRLFSATGYRFLEVLNPLYANVGNSNEGVPVFSVDVENRQVVVSDFSVVFEDSIRTYSGATLPVVIGSGGNVDSRAAAIVLNVVTGALSNRLMTSGGLGTLGSKEYIICCYYPSTGYIIFGSEVNSYEFNNTEFSLTHGSPILGDFKFASNVIEHGGIRVINGGKNYNIPAQNITLPSSRSAAQPHAVLFRVGSSELSVKELRHITAGDGIPLYFYNEALGIVYNNHPYKVNGVDNSTPNSASASHLDASKSIAFNDSEPSSILPVADSHGATDPMPLRGAFDISTLTSGTVYGWFDALVTAYPEFVTREQLAMDASNAFPIYAYRFRANEVREDIPMETPRALLFGLHSETLNFVGMHVFMRELCESWSTNPRLAALRWGADIMVIPCANPWGLDNRSRPNVNGVDINRNFPNGWIYNDPVENPQRWSGPTPASEIETQTIMSVIETFKPHVALDVHAFHGGADRWVWINQNDPAYRIAAQNAVLQTYQKMKADYPALAGRTLDTFFYIRNEESYNGIAGNFILAAGAIGGTIEFSRDSVVDTYIQNEEVVVAASTLMNVVYEGFKVWKLYGRPTTTPKPIPE